MNVCEIYTSIQGEGPNTGSPITFVRFGGCNLRCPGWGTGTLPDGTSVPGCDTTFAVYPEWRGTWESQTVDDVLRRVPDTPRHVCLTGGEPLIQPRKDLNKLAFELQMGGYSIDLFTNGTRRLGNYLWHGAPNVTVVMDWKLPGSGEYGSFDIWNVSALSKKDAIKFVVKDRDDWQYALDIIQHHDLTKVTQIYFGPVWDVMDPTRLAEWVQYEAPYAHLNIQTHKYIWDPDERRV